MSPGLPKHTYDSGERRIHTRSHVQRLHSKPGRINSDHLNSSRSHCAHSWAAIAGHCTITTVPPRRTSIWIGDVEAGVAQPLTEMGLEGVVAKRKASVYRCGERRRTG